MSGTMQFDVLPWQPAAGPGEWLAGLAVPQLPSDAPEVWIYASQSVAPEEPRPEGFSYNLARDETPTEVRFATSDGYYRNVLYVVPGLLARVVHIPPPPWL